MADVEVEQGVSRARTGWATVAVVGVTVGALLALLTAAVLALSLNIVSSTWSVVVPVTIVRDAPVRVWDQTVDGRLNPVQPLVDGPVLWVDSTDRWTAAMSEPGRALTLAVVGAAALVLIPVLRALVAGRGLVAGAGGRVLIVAGMVAIAWAAAAVLPYVAAARGIAVIGAPVAEWVVPALRYEWWPLVVVVLLVLLGVALWRGARAARDVEGLV